MPLIVTAMILAMQRLKEMTGGGNKLAKWTVGYYVATTIIAIVHSTILVSLVWRPMYAVAGEDSLAIDEDDQDTFDERSDNDVTTILVNIFDSFIPGNIFAALAENQLLAVLVTAVVVGGLLEPGSSIIKAVVEVERLITKVIIFLIKLAPIGVFFLILSNIIKLDPESIGKNLGILIGSSLVSMFIHLFVVLPLIYFAFVRQNPFTYWMKNSPAWITAWGTASSAATLPVTMRCVRARGWPETVIKFTVPLGCLVNMDGTAIYFPAVVVFMAQTQGITLNAGEYVIVVLLATLSSIATTPIPSSSLVLTVIICQSVGVPVTGMYAVVIAIDWFIDRFRTALNVSSDLFAVGVITKITGISDADGVAYEATVEERHAASIQGAAGVRQDSKV
jgi:Na+/H+-dicarboxylate symporter